MGPSHTIVDSALSLEAKLQRLVPDLTLVGGSAAALHAGHRVSFDHDHVLTDLTDRYASVVDAVEATDGWATAVRASHPPLTLMGSLDGVQAGIRQLRRTAPIETEMWEISEDVSVRVPTLEEILRIKAFLTVDRGAVRDFLDLAALADRVGLERATEVLARIDDYYAARSDEAQLVSTEVALALAAPKPKDAAVIAELDRYKALEPRWHDWSEVVAVCQQIAEGLASS